MERFKVFTKFDGVSFHDEIECHSMIIKGGAYLFLSKEWRNDSSYNNIIKSYPVTFTIVERITNK